MVAAESDITLFLKRFKHYARRKLLLVPRPVNMSALSDLGLLPRDAKALLMGLSSENYCKGPETDRDRKGPKVWMFGLCIAGKGVYVKLSDNFKSNRARCISFHETTAPMNYPYKRRAKK